MEFVPLCSQSDKSMNVVGVMSGSSMDGLDLALVAFSDEEKKWDLQKSDTVALPDSLKSSLKEIMTFTAIDIARTESHFSNFVAHSITEFLGPSEHADLIGIHGHTLLHLPEIQTSWQLLNGGMIAEKTNCPVVCDFRNQDLSLNGQGTPMAVIADRDLYPGYDYYINLGGIANMSYQDNGQWVAFDLCPCNQILNHYSQLLGKPYDEHGDMARNGTLNRALLEALLKDPFILGPPPKSIDNTWVKDVVRKDIDLHNLSIPDVLHTVVAYISEVISNHINKEKAQVLLSGGGTYNTFLIDKLCSTSQMKKIEFHIPDNETIDYKEAILIAYCAQLRYKGQTNFLSVATGASKDSIGGALYLPA